MLILNRPYRHFALMVQDGKVIVMSKYHQIIMTKIFKTVGLMHFKAIQDKKLSPEDIYI